MSTENMFKAACDLMLIEKELREKIKEDPEIVKIVSDSLKHLVTCCGISEIFNKDGSVKKTNEFLTFSLFTILFKRCKDKNSNPLVKELEKSMICFAAESPIERMTGLLVQSTAFEIGCKLGGISAERYDKMKYDQETVELTTNYFLQVAEKHGLSNLENTELFYSNEQFQTDFLREVFLGCEHGTRAAELTLEFMNAMYESLESQNDSPDLLKKTKEAMETMTRKVDKSDPWVTFRNERMRYSKFLDIDRKKCSVYKVRANEYIAFDAEELQNGLDALGVQWDLEEHAISLEEHFGDDPSGHLTKDEAERWMRKCNKIAETGKAVAEVIEKGEPYLDPRVLLLAEKRKKRNRKTRENKKMKKAMAKENEEKGVHVEIVDEEESTAVV